MCMSGVSRMSAALQWVEQIRSDLRPLEDKILGHSYLTALDEGRLQRDQLKVFAGQQHHIISSDLRSIALIVSRQGMHPSRRFLMNVLQEEAAALDALHAFADALGLDASHLEVLEPLPAAHAYCAFVAWLALYGSDAELAGGFLINFPAWEPTAGGCARHSMRSTMLPQQRSPCSTFSPICLLSNRKLSASFKMPSIGVCPHDSFTRRRACYKAMS